MLLPHMGVDERPYPISLREASVEERDRVGANRLYRLKEARMVKGHGGAGLRGDEVQSKVRQLTVRASAPPPAPSGLSPESPALFNAPPAPRPPPPPTPAPAQRRRPVSSQDSAPAATPQAQLRSSSGKSPSWDLGAGFDAGHEGLEVHPGRIPDGGTGVLADFGDGQARPAG